jgi:hypothetical protein
MKKEEAFQIQRGDYFLYYGSVVKVVGKSPYNESHYTIENKNGSKFYAEVEELQPITINDYTLKQGGFERKINTDWYHYNGVSLYFRDIVKVILLKGADLDMDISHFHVLQNALRLFGIELNIK